MNYSDMGDDDLIKLVTKGDQDALGMLYDRYGRLVYSVAYASVGRSELAAEISQEVFLGIWQKAETFDAQKGKLKSWMAQIARNRAIDTIRGLTVRPEGNLVNIDIQDFRLDESQFENPIEETVEKSIRRMDIRTALKQLPESQRKTLAMAYFRGMTNQEIADELGEPLGTVKTQIRLGMQKLRTLLEEHGIKNGDFGG